MPSSPLGSESIAINKMANGSQPPNDERTPLLDSNNHVDENGREGTPEEDFVHLNDQVKTWRRRRWISLIVSAFLILAFIVILILSGGKWYPPKLASSLDLCWLDL